MELTQNNISTIVVFIYMLLSPFLLKYGIEQDLFTTTVTGIIGIIIAIWSARNPNTLSAFNNNGDDTNESC